jgi:hypothetical protein
MQNKISILFINSPEPDYLQDLCYSGLAEILGSENIIDIPWNPHYHIATRKYPRNLGFSPGSFFPSLMRRFSKSHFNAVIVGSAKPKCLKAYGDLIASIPDSVPVVFLDGGDWPEVGGDLKRLKSWSLYAEVTAQRPFDVIFKREILSDREYPVNVHPLPFGFNFHRLPQRIDMIEKKYQVSFWAVESNQIRTKALDILQDNFDCRGNGTIHNQVFSKYHRKGKRYLEELAACRIVINMPGVGWDTMRYWEAPAVGSLLVSMRPKILIPEDFTDRQEIVYCKDDLSDLLELCRYYLENEPERLKIAKAGQNKVKKFHSNLSRAGSILNIIENFMK